MSPKEPSANTEMLTDTLLFETYADLLTEKYTATNEYVEVSPAPLFLFSPVLSPSLPP